MSGGDCCGDVQLDTRNAAERRTLKWVFAINLMQAVVVGFIGIAVDSAGLLGAALDNLADGGVYALSLYAVGRTAVAQSQVARTSGVFLIVLGVALFAEVIRRFVMGAEPVGVAMMITAAANAGTNLVCLALLRSHRADGVHLEASWIFTSNDMLANAGIVASGAAVMIFGSPLPDLLIGVIVVAIAVKGGFEILERARAARADSEDLGAPDTEAKESQRP